MEWLWIDVPPARLAEARETARVLGDEVFNKFPFVPGMQPLSKDPLELLLNRTWRPALAYTGQAGMPDLVQGGNVLRPKTSLKLSLRFPPARLFFVSSIGAAASSSPPASDAACTGFFLISSVLLSASMMSITGATCGSGASTTF